MKFDVLAAYADWFSKQPFAVPPSIPDGVSRVAGFSGLILHRSEEFQTQLWICDPHAESGDHSHPMVDSIMLPISGEVLLRIYDESGNIVNKGTPFARVGPGVKHGATVGPKGGCFLAFQRWLNGVPKSVEQDWEGPALDAHHEEALKP